MNKYLTKVAALYQEGPDSKFTHMGGLYSLDKALRLAANRPTVSIPVDELSWVLKYDTPDPKRVAAADLSKPLLVVRWGKRLVAVDGLHRLTKAVQQGRNRIGVRIIGPNLLEQAKWNSAL